MFTGCGAGGWMDECSDWEIKLAYRQYLKAPDWMRSPRVHRRDRLGFGLLQP